MRPFLVLAFLPLVLLAMVFDLVCALSVLGWIVLFINDGLVTARVLDLLRSALQ